MDAGSSATPEAGARQCGWSRTVVMACGVAGMRVSLPGLRCAQFVQLADAHYMTNRGKVNGGGGAEMSTCIRGAQYHIFTTECSKPLSCMQAANGSELRTVVP